MIQILLKHAACFIFGHQAPLFSNNVEGKEGNRALMSQEDWIVQSFEWVWYFAVWLTGEEGEEGHRTATCILTPVWIPAKHQLGLGADIQI